MKQRNWLRTLEEQKDRENGCRCRLLAWFRSHYGWCAHVGFRYGWYAWRIYDDECRWTEKKENATEGEREAHDAMMGAIHENNKEERYSGNADFLEQAGVMTGYMPSFMLDFVLTGGGFNGLSSFSKGSTRLATKVIKQRNGWKNGSAGFKSYIKENGAKGLGRYATDWTIKALSTTADDLFVRVHL